MNRSGDTAGGRVKKTRESSRRPLSPVLVRPFVDEQSEARPDHFPDCPRSGSVSSRVVTLHVPRCRRCSTDAYSRRLLGMRRASSLTLRVMIRTLSGKLSWVLAGFARLLRPEPWSVYRWSVKLRAKAPRRVYGPGTPAPPPRLLLSDRSASGAAGGGGGTQQTHKLHSDPAAIHQQHG